MSNKLFQKRYTKFTSYYLIYNKSFLDIKIKRIKTYQDFYNSLIRRKELKSNEGYFRYQSKGFQSYLISFQVDLIFVNNDGQIIDMKKSFATNKISNYVEKAKFLYILSEGSIDRNKLEINNVLKHRIRK